MNEIYEDLRGFSVANNVDYVSIRTDVPIEKMIFGNLIRKGIIS